MTQAHPISLCVFCGSSLGPIEFVEATKQLGLRLAASQVSVVYGGGNIGLMGILADSILESDGRVIGVIPQFLIEMEVAHHGLSELVVVDSMHERKAEMASRSDAFVALPGGFGTMEEFFEVLTWLQLGLHSKPCVLLNLHGFYTPLLQFFSDANKTGYISNDSMALLRVCTTIDELIDLTESLAHQERFREDKI